VGVKIAIYHLRLNQRRAAAWISCIMLVRKR